MIAAMSTLRAATTMRARVGHAYVLVDGQPPMVMTAHSL
jgi:hypothetical protein